MIYFVFVGYPNIPALFYLFSIAQGLSFLRYNGHLSPSKVELLTFLLEPLLSSSIHVDDFFPFRLVEI